MVCKFSTLSSTLQVSFTSVLIETCRNASHVAFGCYSLIPSNVIPSLPTARRVEKGQLVGLSKCSFNEEMRFMLLLQFVHNAQSSAMFFPYQKPYTPLANRHRSE